MDMINGGENIGDHSLAIWECVNRFYHSTRKAVNVLVGNNCDAAAASLTLSSLFRSSLISFSLHPVSSYDELQNIVEAINVSQDFAMSTTPSSRSDELFVLIGVGAPVSLVDYFDLSRHIVIVIDSQRPFHLQNLRLGATATSAVDSRFIIWGFSRIQEDVDAFFRKASEQERRKRRRTERRMEARRRRLLEHGAEGLTTVLVDDDDESDESDEDEASDSGDMDSLDEDGGANDNEEEEVDWMRADGVSLPLQQRYGASQGSCRSCALEVYDLSTLLNRTSDSFVWHAAVGVCDLFRRRCIDYGSYLVEMRPLHDAVVLHQGSRRQGMLQLEGGGRTGPLGELPINTIQNLRETSSNAMRLLTIDQPPFLLLQHISLWDAMWNDAAVASALGFHHAENGESTLKLLLAKCGVSLEMAQRPWFEVPKDERNAAMRLIQHELKPFFSGARGAMVASPSTTRMIARAVGFSREVTTFDVCVLFDAVLAASPSSSLYTVNRETVGEEPLKQVITKRLSEFYREQFWRAHALVDMDPSRKEFSAAITEAVHLHRIIGESTSALMQPSLILSTQGLHYIQLNDPGKTASALESFHTPARLQALGNRLLHTLTAERGLRRYTGSIRPLLLASPVPREGILPEHKAATEASGSGSSTSPGEDEVAYVVLMVSEGVRGTTGLHHSRDLHIFNECVEKTDAFEKIPSRSSVLRQCVFVQGRENAIHVAEMMHLRSLEM